MLAVRGLCLAVAAALLPACATVAYDGPRRPDHEVAIHYEAGGERADASNVTLALGFYFFN